MPLSAANNNKCSHERPNRHCETFTLRRVPLCVGATPDSGHRRAPDPRVSALHLCIFPPRSPDRLNRLPPHRPPHRPIPATIIASSRVGTMNPSPTALHTDRIDRCTIPFSRHRMVRRVERFRPPPPPQHRLVRPLHRPTPDPSCASTKSAVAPPPRKQHGFLRRSVPAAWPLHRQNSI